MALYWLSGLTLGFSAGVSPGPFQAYMMMQSLRLGVRRALPAALAPLLSDGPIIALALLALSRIPAGFLHVLQVVGGVYLLYLAWNAFRAWRCFSTGVVTPTQERQSMPQAVLMNFLSPGPYIFWSMLAGPLLLQGWRAHPGYGLAFLAGFYFAMIGCNAVFIVLVGSVGQRGRSINRAMLGVSALAMLLLGLIQIWNGLTG